MLEKFVLIYIRPLPLSCQRSTSFICFKFFPAINLHLLDYLKSHPFHYVLYSTVLSKMVHLATYGLIHCFEDLDLLVYQALPCHVVHWVRLDLLLEPELIALAINFVFSY